MSLQSGDVDRGSGKRSRKKTAAIDDDPLWLFHTFSWRRLVPRKRVEDSFLSLKAETHTITAAAYYRSCRLLNYCASARRQRVAHEGTVATWVIDTFATCARSWKHARIARLQLTGA